jgi:hypothetical protein
MAKVPTFEMDDASQKGRRGDYEAFEKIVTEYLDTKKGVMLTYIKDTFGISEQSLRNHFKDHETVRIQILSHKSTKAKGAFFFTK